MFARADDTALCGDSPAATATDLLLAYAPLSPRAALNDTGAPTAGAPLGPKPSCSLACAAAASRLAQLKEGEPESRPADSMYCAARAKPDKFAAVLARPWLDTHAAAATNAGPAVVSNDDGGTMK